MFCVSREGCGCSDPKDRGHNFALKNNHCLLDDPEAICAPSHCSSSLPWPSYGATQPSWLAIGVTFISATDLLTAQSRRPRLLQKPLRHGTAFSKSHLMWIWLWRPRTPVQLYASGSPLGIQVTAGNDVCGLNFIMTIIYGWLDICRHSSKCSSYFLSCNPLNNVMQVWLSFPFFQMRKLASSDE